MRTLSAHLGETEAGIQDSDPSSLNAEPASCMGNLYEVGRLSPPRWPENNTAVCHGVKLFGEGRQV